MVCAVINESSRTALECALCFECRAKKRLNPYKRGFEIYDLLVLHLIQFFAFKDLVRMYKMKKIVGKNSSCALSNN